MPEALSEYTVGGVIETGKADLGLELSEDDAQAVIDESRRLIIMTEGTSHSGSLPSIRDLIRRQIEKNEKARFFEKASELYFVVRSLYLKLHPDGKYWPLESLSPRYIAKITTFSERFPPEFKNRTAEYAATIYIPSIIKRLGVMLEEFDISEGPIVGRTCYLIENSQISQVTISNITNNGFLSLKTKRNNKYHIKGMRSIRPDKCLFLSLSDAEEHLAKSDAI
jgi:hypothetical protein